MKIQYKDGIKYVYFNEGGLHMEIPHNKDGLKDGIAKVYAYFSGHLQHEVPFKNGLIDGVQKIYNKEGNIIKEIHYQNNEIVGDDSFYKNEIEEYKGFRYFTNLEDRAWSPNYYCGYIIINEELFEKLGLDHCVNHTSEKDGEITFVYEIGDKVAKTQKYDEIYFGIDTNHIWSYDRSPEYVEYLLKEWIDWINLQKLEAN